MIAPPSTCPPAPFVVGAGRSGTTLLRMMLDSHSTLAIPPETDFAAAAEPFRQAGATAAACAMTDSWRWQDFNISAAEFIRRVREERPRSLGDVMRIFYRLYAELMDKPRWGDKSPYYVWGMKAIDRLLPEAHFVHVIRDGRDVALSVLPLWFGPDTVAEAASDWVEIVAAARRQAPDLSSYTEVRYEDLIGEPERILRELCDLLELGWEAAMLDYHVAARRRLASETADGSFGGRLVPREERMRIHRLIGKPPQRAQIGRWRSEMSAADLRAFERIAGDTLGSLGYELATRRRASA